MNKGFMLWFRRLFQRVVFTVSLRVAVTCLIGSSVTCRFRSTSKSLTRCSWVIDPPLHIPTRHTSALIFCQANNIQIFAHTHHLGLFCNSSSYLSICCKMILLVSGGSRIWMLGGLQFWPKDKIFFTRYISKSSKFKADVDKVDLSEKTIN